MYRHMYNWNIDDWDVISKKWTWTQNWHIWQKLDLNNIEFVENAQNEKSAIYFKGNKFGEDVPIKKKQAWQVCTGLEKGGSGRGRGGARTPPSKVDKGTQVGVRPPPLLDRTFVLISLFAHNLLFEMIFLNYLKTQKIFFIYILL